MSIKVHPICYQMSTKARNSLCHSCRISSISDIVFFDLETDLLIP